jgi:hypothetical protein
MIRKKMVVASVGLVFMAGSGSASRSLDIVSPNLPVVQEAFDQMRGYWVEQGVGAAAATRLVTLREREDVFFCSNNVGAEQRAISVEPIRSLKVNTIAQYCAGDNTIVLLEKALIHRAEAAGQSLDMHARWVGAHELGHVVAAARGYVHDSGGNLIIENRADCYGGQALAHTNPALVPIIVSHLREARNSATHGTPGQRVAAVLAGAQDGANCAEYQPIPLIPVRQSPS